MHIQRSNSNQLSERSSLGSPPGSARYLAVSVLLVACYVAAGKLGLALAIANPSVSSVWAPTGIALAALLVLGFEYWPAIFIGAFLANIATSGAALSSLGISAGNTLEALVGVYLVNRFAGGTKFLERPRTIFRFVFVAALASTAISATIGIASLALNGLLPWADLGSTWFTWWVGDAVGDILLVPVLLSFWSAPAFPHWDRRKIIEGSALLISILAVALLLFGGIEALPVTWDFGMKFLIIPPLLWAAFRFGVMEAAVAVLFMACVTIGSVLRGPAIANESMLVLQVFMGILGVMTVTVATVVARQNETEQALRKAHGELEARVELSGEALAEAVREVRFNETLLARAQQIAHTGSFQWDAASNTVSGSPELQRIYDRTPSELTGTLEKFLSFVHPEDVESVRSTLDRALQSNQPFRMRQRIVRNNGEVRMLECAGEVITDQGGQAAGILGVCRDITDENRAHEALHQSEANFRGMVEHAPYGVVIADYSGMIVLVNEESERIFGYSRQELLGQRVEILVPERYRANHPAHRRLFTANPRVRPMGGGRELYGLRKDGSEFPVEIGLSPLRTQGGGLISSVIRDITERKQAEHALREVAGRLINAQEEERRRLGRELHDDLSQRLALLAMQLDRIRMRYTADVPAVANELEGLARQVSNITEDVHRLSHGLHSSLLEHLGIVPALQSLTAEFSDRHGLQIQFAPESMPRKLPVDVALCLYRIVQEGLNNIAKHSGSRSARIELARRADGVHLTMEDHGIGFDAKSLEGKGGLGFISMRERLRLVGGEFNIRSVHREGTRIDIWIPMQVMEGAGTHPVAPDQAVETGVDTLL